MSSTSYESVRKPPPALGVSKASSARVAKVLYGAGEASRSGIWVGIFAITMSFAAFTSALFVRQGSSADWVHIALPAILYGNTLALLLSSATLQMVRRAILAVVAGGCPAPPQRVRWAMAPPPLGVVFFCGQYQTQRRGAAARRFLPSPPHITL